MRSLFLRIFLSFWLAQALFVILAILVTLAVGPRPSPRWEYLRASLGSRIVTAYERSGEVEARNALEELQHRLHVRAYVFDDQGQEISRRPPPDWALQELRGEPPRRRNLFEGLFSQRFVSQSVAGPSGRGYTLVAELPPNRRLFFGRERIPGLGIGIAVLSSGLVCYLLAWYLTSPVVRLRAATQRLAQGDLAARAGDPASRRHDEIGGLVRDFDSMAERLENLVNAQSRLLKDISHELRSPLARLSVALGLARQRSGPEAEAALERIELEAGRLNELIGRLLTLSRLEGGEEIMEKVPLSLGELVREIVKDANFEAQGRNRRVDCVIAEDCLVEGNAALLRSAIENVVRNATRYTREGTAVEARLERVTGPAGNAAVVRVTDHGAGVPEEALDKLFQPFYRLDDARVRETGGVGLGLAITERAMRAHAGSVRAVNRPEGGLMVELRLPLATRSTARPADAFADTDSP
jgi:two-component system sensor histidine kinase CpxA